MAKQWFILQQDKSGPQPMDGEHYATEAALIRSMIYAGEDDLVFEYDTDAMTISNVTAEMGERAYWDHAHEMSELIEAGYCGLIASAMPDKIAVINDRLYGEATRADWENDTRWDDAAGSTAQGIGG